MFICFGSLDQGRTLRLLMFHLECVYFDRHCPNNIIIISKCLEFLLAMVCFGSLVGA